MAALRIRSAAAGQQKLTTNWGDHRNGYCYNYMRNCQRTQHRPFCGHLACEANWKCEKAQYVGASWILKGHLFLFYAIANYFSIRLWHVTKSGFYMTTSDNQCSGWTEEKLQNTFQSQICTKERSWSLKVVCCVWSTTAFWIPVKTITSERYAL